MVASADIKASRPLGFSEFETERTEMNEHGGEVLRGIAIALLAVSGAVAAAPVDVSTGRSGR
jgi:hypothetical protein